MDGGTDEDERGELLRRLFAAMTMALEDLAGVAADGQGPSSRDEARDRAERVRQGAEHVAALGDAVHALARG